MKKFYTLGTAWILINLVLVFGLIGCSGYNILTVAAGPTQRPKTSDNWTQVNIKGYYDYTGVDEAGNLVTGTLPKAYNGFAVTKAFVQSYTDLVASYGKYLTHPAYPPADIAPLSAGAMATDGKVGMALPAGCYWVSKQVEEDRATLNSNYAESPQVISGLKATSAPQ